MTTRLRTRPAFLSVCALTVLCAGAARAQDTNSPYFIGASQTFSHDSNTLQLTDGATVPTGYSRSDSISTTSLLAGFDQAWGRQRGYANLALRDNRYARNSTFDNRSYNASVGLDWSTVERISGTLTGSANRSLQRFNTADINLTTAKNLQTVENLGATVNVGMVTKYSLDLGGSRLEVRNSLDRNDVQARNFSQEAANAGLRYSPSAALSFGLGLAATRGRYPKFRTAANGEYEADRFKRNDLRFTTSYRPSGASQLDLRLSHGRTKYDLNEARDFSGLTGNLAWAWQATGKLRLNVNAARDTGQDSYPTALLLFPGFPVIATADYSRVIKTYRVSANYAATAKIGITAGLSRWNRSLVRTVDNEFFTDATGQDHSTTYALGVNWAPLRAASFGCSYSNEQRQGTGQLVAPFHNTSVSCYGQITLQ